MKLTAEQIVRKSIGGNNAITPHIIEYQLIDENTAYELSEGTFMYGRRVYGVTVCKHENGEYFKESDKGKLCFSRDEVDEHIAQLKKVGV